MDDPASRRRLDLRIKVHALLIRMLHEVVSCDTQPIRQGPWPVDVLVGEFAEVCQARSILPPWGFDSITAIASDAHDSTNDEVAEYTASLDLIQTALEQAFPEMFVPQSKPGNRARPVPCDLCHTAPAEFHQMKHSSNGAWLHKYCSLCHQKADIS